MGWGFTKAEEAELERLALERGATVTRAELPAPVAYPAPEENRLAWSEKKFQAEVVKLAEGLGWLTYHTWMSIRSRAGFPDLVLVRHDRLVFAELKKQKGKKPTKAQTQWREALVAAGVAAYLWRPADWESIVEVLK